MEVALPVGDNLAVALAALAHLPRLARHVPITRSGRAGGDRCFECGKGQVPDLDALPKGRSHRLIKMRHKFQPDFFSKVRDVVEHRPQPFDLPRLARHDLGGTRSGRAGGGNEIDGFKHPFPIARFDCRDSFFARREISTDLASSRPTARHVGAVLENLVVVEGDMGVPETAVLSPLQRDNLYLPRLARHVHGLRLDGVGGGEGKNRHKAAGDAAELLASVTRYDLDVTAFALPRVVLVLRPCVGREVVFRPFDFLVEPSGHGFGHRLVIRESAGG